MEGWIQANDWVLYLIFVVPMAAAAIVIGLALFRVLGAWRRGEKLQPRDRRRRPGRMRKRMRGTFGGR